MIEAKCTRCDETFNPESDDPEDLIHGECGGIGVIQGQWNIPGVSGLNSQEMAELALTAQEQHGLERPECDSPSCPWHFPWLFVPCSPGPTTS